MLFGYTVWLTLALARIWYCVILFIYTLWIFDAHKQVSHWMDHGNAISYVKSHPDADRLRILSEVAAGPCT